MPPTAPDPEVLAQWLASARSDLLYSEIAPPEGAMYEQPSFHAQQAVEKALKALLLSLDEEPPYIHDIRALLALLRERMDLPESFEEAADLTAYAVTTRYPPSVPPVCREDWEAAVRIAREVVGWVQQRLRRE
ncbi:MAG: HEPN domain-containing protein [Armatimonadetes bacterium]|nr:HEPN domain-containing protein [Armatimonadota bacterium]